MNKLVGCWPYILLLFIFCGCQTTDVGVSPSLPVYFQSAFDSCLTGDGSLSVQLDKGKQLFRGSLQMDWVAHGRKGWAIEIYTPLGQTLLSARYSGGNFQLQQTKISELSDVSFSREGFIQIGSYTVPLKVKEIPCFLKGKLPRTWNKKIVRFQRDRNSAQFLVADSPRNLLVTFQNLSDARKSKLTCVDITLRKFWGLFNQTMRVCINDQKPKIIEVSGIEPFKVRLMQVED